MISEIVTIKGSHYRNTPNTTKPLVSEYYGLSTDTKPIDGVENADIFYEMDTKKIYLFDGQNKTWLEQ